jgi:uncharacterized membrane-anchored protein
MSFVEFTGPARLDRRTKRLTRRLKPGDIAIIDHRDIDRVSAEELLDSGARVVVNCSPSQSGRFPNPGPLLLVRGGVELIDVAGSELFDAVNEGDLVSVRGSSLFRNGDRIASGRTLSADELTRALDEQRGRVTQALEEFAENTMRHLREEGGVLAGAVEFPPLRTSFRDRHALVVARGPGMKRDLRIVQGYIRDFKPVLVAVDGGADALLEIGRKPDVIVGDMDSVSDEALRSGAEIVVHATAATATHRGRRGSTRISGVAYQRFRARHQRGLAPARIREGRRAIVAVGTHLNLIEFLRARPRRMASTFVTRLKVGEILVDAKGVSRLVSRRVGVWPLVVLTLAGFGAIVTAILVSPQLRHVIELVSLKLQNLLGL